MGFTTNRCHRGHPCVLSGAHQPNGDQDSPRVCAPASRHRRLRRGGRWYHPARHLPPRIRGHPLGCRLSTSQCSARQRLCCPLFLERNHELRARQSRSRIPLAAHGSAGSVEWMVALWPDHRVSIRHHQQGVVNERPSITSTSSSQCANRFPTRGSCFSIVPLHSAHFQSMIAVPSSPLRQCRPAPSPDRQMVGRKFRST